MRLKKLVFENFKSFHDEHSFYFPDKLGGLYLLSGQNVVNPDLGPNAVGKSTLWDVLTWVLFGKSVRGVRGKNLASWGQSEWYSASLDFEKGGKDYTLFRTWSPGKLQLNGRDITQEELEDALGFGFSLFLSTCVLGQFSRFFFDLSPQEKLNIFTETLGLELWTRASLKAGSKIDFLEARKVTLLRKREGLLGRLSSLKEQKSRFKSSFSAYQKEKNLKLTLAERELARTQKKLVEDQEQLHALSVRLQKAKDLCEKAERKIFVLDKELQQQTNFIFEERTKLASFGARIDTIKKQSESLATLSGRESACPYCQQTVSESHCKHVLEKWNSDLAALQVEKDQLFLFIKEKLNEVELLKKEKERRIKKYEQRLARVKKYEDLRRLGSGQLASCQDKKEGILARLAELGSNANPYRRELKQIKKSISLGRGTLDFYERRLHVRDSELRAASFWPQGFKELRLWLVEVALKEFELEVNSSLVELGLIDWKITFAIERETQAGTIARGFTVGIQSPTSGEIVPFEAWSGGETQRLRIAGSVGLANFIRARCGINLPLEVWDEPTAHLSQEGIEDLLEFFYNRSRRQGKQIWLVEHKALDAGNFDDIFVVVKDQLGSRIRAS